MYDAINDDNIKLDITVVRVVTIDRCYATLRQIDSQSPESDKHIILDFSTNAILQTVLQQVWHF